MLADVVIVVSVAIVAGVVALFVLSDKHPESAASHSDEHPDTLAERFYGPHPPGPAGPDAESQGPETPELDMPRAFVISWPRRPPRSRS